MAFAKASDNKKFVLPNTDTQIFKAYVEKEDLCAYTWFYKWGWILDEYKDMKEKLAAISKKSVITKTEEATDFRSLKPFPNSINHEYGWISTKKDFRLEIYGPDVPKPSPVLD